MSEKSSREEVAQLSHDDTDFSAITDAEKQALVYLRRGLSKGQIIDRLAEDGLSREEAKRVADNLWKSQSDERRTNAYILLGVATFIMLVSSSFLALRLLNGDSLPRMSVHYLLIALAVWFIVKATGDLRKL